MNVDKGAEMLQGTIEVLSWNLRTTSQSAVQSVKKYKVDRTDREDNGIADLNLTMVQSTLFHDSMSFLWVPQRSMYSAFPCFPILQPLHPPDLTIFASPL